MDFLDYSAMSEPEHLLPFEVDNRKGKYYDLKDLSERHKEIMRRLSLGESKGNIAMELGVTTATIRNISHSVLGKEYIATLRGERESSVMSIQEQITAMAPEALDVIRQTIRGKMGVEIDKDDGSTEIIEQPVDYKTRFAAAKDILSRDGYVPPTKIDGSISHIHSTQEIVDAAKEKINAARIANPNYTVKEIEEE